MKVHLHEIKLLKLMCLGYMLRDAYLRRQPDSRRAAQHRCQFYEKAWRDAAAYLGAKVELLGKGILEIRLGDACTRVQQNYTPLDDPVTLAVAGDKLLVYRRLAEAGLRVPRHLSFRLEGIASAADFMEKLAAECVVKPAGSSFGCGVSTGIRRRLDLACAAAAAAAYSENVLIEQQVKGDVYRLLYLDGELLDAVLRKPPAVVADGRHSIRQLVRLENQARLTGGMNLAQALVPTDADMRRTLAGQGFSLSSVPQPGRVVRLKSTINYNSTPQNLSAKGLLCDSVIHDGRTAAAALAVRLAGVDIVTPAPGIPLAESGGVILEVNTTPGYHYHYYQQGGGCPVAVHILSRLLLGAQGVSPRISGADAVSSPTLVN